MIEAKDITFIIPVRIDTIERLENLMCSIENLHTHFISNIFVLEASAYNNHIIESLTGDKIQYTFIEDHNPIFYRTRYLNIMITNSKTPYIAIWDADVIVPYTQIYNALLALRSNKYQVAFPFNGSFFETTELIRNIFLKNRDLKILTNNTNKMLLPYGSSANGGAIFIKKDAYVEAGLENENFYGWAPEDVERKERLEKLVGRVFRSQGPLFHLTHPRNLNSSYRSDLQKQEGLFLLEQTRFSSARELNQSINNIQK